jgi:acetylornithine deacetylase/succinyl-diaminopimelate desuccinylase-like protein
VAGIDLMTSEAILRAVCAEVNVDRLVERTMRLLSLPSPPGQESVVAHEYASMLSDIMMSVNIDQEFPESPSVIARTSNSSGRVLQFDGHLDTVSTPHQPASLIGGVIVGRGACDMKGGLAVIAEVVQVLTDLDVPLDGSILVTAHGQHEEAVNGRPLHAPLLGLLSRGIKGDACLIPEGPHRELPLSGRGLVIFKVVFSRPGEPVHEILSGPVPPPNPLTACLHFVSKLEENSKSWSIEDPLAGKESYFVGSINGGDYYNRIPNEGHVWGTRRYPKGQIFEVVQSELVELANAAADVVGCDVRLEIEKSGQPFSIPSSDPLVTALRDSNQFVAERDLPLVGMQYSADASQFINVGRIPALYHGTNSTTAHANVESVDVKELVRCSQVMLCTVCNYLGFHAN